MQSSDPRNPTDCSLDSSVVDWIIEHPETTRLFEELGIDCSCAGRSLQYACHQRGLDPWVVLARLMDRVAASQ